MNIELKHVAPLPGGTADARPAIPAAEYERRMQALYAAAQSNWVLVYGDREHAANLAFLSGFDPRFEEALLLLGPRDRRVLLVGNEGMGYVGEAGLPLEAVLCQSLSLMGQPRDSAPRLDAVLHAAGISSGARIGIVGWKYLEAEECDDPRAPAFVPAFLVDAVRGLVGHAGAVFDATPLLMHPADGLKSRNVTAQIAASEWAAVRASDAVWRMVRGTRPGMSEYECVALMGYAGEPLSCHVMFATGSGPIVGLRSPSARRLAHGDGVTTAVGYQGGLSCRAGLLCDQPDDAFFASIVVPYYRAIATWYASLRIGASGDSIDRAVMAALGDAPFRPALNPGHLVALDEWTHTPIRPGSQERLSSGMLLQCDIIPAPLPAGQALNCEDTVALADDALRAAIRAEFPELWQRIVARRVFMHDALGIQLPDELLPLSSAPAYLPPFWLAPELVCACS